MKFVQFSVLPLATLALACSHQAPPRTVASGASCSTLPDLEQAVSELYEPGTVYAAEPIKKRIFRARADQPERVVGASLRVRAESELSAPYLQRVLACHASGTDSAGPSDPLHPTHGAVAEISVDESKFGFVVNIEGDDLKSGEEIWKRAEVFAHRDAVVR